MWSFSSQVTLHSNTQACLQSIDIAVYFCASFLRVKCQKLVKMLSKIHTLGNTRISTDDAQKCISPQHCTAQWCMKMKLRMASSKLDVMNSRNMLTNTVPFQGGRNSGLFWHNISRPPLPIRAKSAVCIQNQMWRQPIWISQSAEIYVHMDWLLRARSTSLLFRTDDQEFLCNLVAACGRN